MAAQTPPYVLQNGSHTAALFRQAFASLFGKTQPGTLTSSAGGVVNTSDLAVTAQASPNMTVNVAGGSCWIPQTQAANGGLYFGLNDATVVVSISASNATNPRVDLVCATVNDAAYSGSTNNWTIQAITGTATAGATLSNLTGAPAIPAASIPLAYILVPAASTSVTSGNIADVRTFLGMPNANRGNPAARMYQTASTSVPGGGTYSQITSLAADFTLGGFTFASNALTVPVAGKYLATATVNTLQTTGVIGSSIYVNGIAARTVIQAANTTAAWATTTDLISLNANDVVSLYAYSTSSTTTNIYSSQGCWLSLELVSR
jgi:hypothetical protein